MQAEVHCSLEDFVNVFDYRIRKCVQTKTKGLRKKQGKCADCGGEAELQAAHPKDKRRKSIITQILLEKYVIEDKVVIYNLKEVEQNVMEAHKPYDEFFRFICQACHQKEHHPES